MSHYARRFERDTLSDGSEVWLVRAPELPGCKAQGRTMDEANASLEDCIVDYKAAMAEWGLEVAPEPTNVIRMEIDFTPPTPSEET